MTTSRVSDSTRRQVALDELPRTLPVDDERDLSNLIRMALRDERKKVDAGRTPMIHTVRGVGYLLRPAD
jgi:DNA-binding response OmpR family regulator